MKQKIIAAGLFLVTIILMIIGYIILREPQIFNLCPAEAIKNCLDSDITLGIAKPLYIGIQALLPLFLLVAFIRPDVFKLWWKFAIPFVLFALYTILGTSPEGGSGGWIYSSPTRTEVTYFFSLWLLSSSLILFATKTFRQNWRVYYTIPAALILSFLVLLFAGVRTFLI